MPVGHVNYSEPVVSARPEAAQKFGYFIIFYLASKHPSSERFACLYNADHVPAIIQSLAG